MMESARVVDQLVVWLRDYVQSANCRGVVFGLSGGIDSAVVAGLAVRAFGDNALGVIMPCYSDPEDAEHAQLCAQALGLSVVTVDLDETFDTMCEALPVADGAPRLAVANLKPRLRMTVLNYYAAARNALVLGGTNRSEWIIGYFTKHGDTGVDLMPIAGLVKQQVRELALYLGVPQVIIDKAPSAGLWAGQTDEQEMGISYEQLDRYILQGEAEPHVRQLVDRLHRQSEHKRRLPPMPPLQLE